MRGSFLHLKSIVMGRIKTVAHGRVAYSYAYQSDLEACGVTSDECDGLVDVVRSVMGVEVCLFLKGIEGDTKVRGNLRSKGDLDVCPRSLPTLAVAGIMPPPAFPTTERFARRSPWHFPCWPSWWGGSRFGDRRALTFWMVHGSSYAFSIEYAARRR